jgi:COMPASS component SWD1
MKLNGHWKQVQSLSWSRCGRYLLTASQDCRATLWDLSTQTRIRTTKFEAPIYTAELHPYNHFLFVVSLFEDHPFLVDIKSEVPVKHRIPTEPISENGSASTKQSTTAAIFSVQGDHIISGTSKGYINIIETSTLHIIHSTKLSTGLFSLLRLTSNGRQLLANSTDRVIRVINMPDLGRLRTSETANAEEDPDDPYLDPSTIYLSADHQFTDVVNRLRWNHTSISPVSSGSATADYVVASTYMKKTLYLYELRSNSLFRILETREESAIIEWHPSRPLFACTSIETGTVQIWGIEPQQKWSALAPDFTEVTENEEYVEREDEFDIYPEAEHKKRREDREDEVVDVLTLDSSKKEDSFVLPMLYNIEDSDGDDQELIRMGVGTMRKKEINEGKAYEADGEEALLAVAAQAKSKKRR